MKAYIYNNVNEKHFFPSKGDIVSKFEMLTVNVPYGKKYSQIKGFLKHIKINRNKNDKQIDIIINNICNIEIISCIAFIKKIFKEYSIVLQFHKCYFDCILNFLNRDLEGIVKFKFVNCCFENRFKLTENKMVNIVFKSVIFRKGLVVSDSIIDELTVEDCIFFDKIIFSNNKFLNKIIISKSNFIIFSDESTTSKIELNDNTFFSSLVFTNIKCVNNYSFYRNRFMRFDFTLGDLDLQCIKFFGDVFNDILTFNFKYIDFTNSKECNGVISFEKVLNNSSIIFKEFEAIQKSQNSENFLMEISRRILKINMLGTGNIVGLNFFDYIKICDERIKNCENLELLYSYSEELGIIRNLGEKNLQKHFFERNRYIYNCRKVEERLVMKILSTQQQNQKKGIIGSIKMLFNCAKKRIYYFVSRLSKYGTSPLNLIFIMFLVFILFVIIFSMIVCFIEKQFDFMTIIKYTGFAFTASGFCEKPYIYIFQIIEALIAIFLNSYLVSVFTALIYRELK